MTKKEIKMIPRMVYMEPELWKLSRRLSLIDGCVHKEAGSASEHVRRAYKSWIKQNRKQLMNVAGINWSEIYI